MKTTIICAVKPSAIVRTLLETYYRFMGYAIVYVCPKGDALSWIADGTHLPPGVWYDRVDDAYQVAGVATQFALVGCESDAAWWACRGVNSWSLWEGEKC